MSVQFLSDNEGHITAVQVPIAEWNKMKDKYPDLDKLDIPVSQWQKDLLDARLKAIETNPDLLLPVERLYDELDLDDEL